MLGKLLQGRYQVTQILRVGGFCQTYLAQDISILGNPTRVVKHLLPSNNYPDSLETLRQLFNREAKALEKLGKYDRVPQLFAHFEEQQEFYLVQEFIEGHTLSEELQPGRCWNEDQVIHLLQEVLGILEFVHCHGLIHRDIKPTNLIRRQLDGRLVLIDFGSVKQAWTQVVTSGKTCASFAFGIPATIAFGTPGYMPTEQERGRPRLNSDIYALGMIGIQALTGLSPRQLLEDVDTGELIWQHQATVSELLANILSKMVRYHFKDRYQSAIEVLQALQALKTQGAEETEGDTSSNKNALLTGVATGVASSLALIFVIYDILQLPAPVVKDQHYPALIKSENTTIRNTTPVNTLTGHSDRVWFVALSLDGQVLVSSSGDKTIKLWNLRTGKLRRTFVGHSGIVWSVALSSDRQTLASGSSDNTIKIWDLSSGELLRTLSGHSDAVRSIALSSDRQTLVSGSSDNTIKIWDLSSGELLRTLSGHSDAVRSIALSSDGQLLASGSSDNTIKIWDLSSGELLRTFSGHTNRVISVALSPDGQLLASGSVDKTIKIWKLSSGEPLRTLSGHSDWVNSVAINSDGRTLASGIGDSLKIWDLKTGELLYTLSGHASDITSVSFSANGKVLISGSGDKTIKIWRL